MSDDLVEQRTLSELVTELLDILSIGDKIAPMATAPIAPVMATPSEPVTKDKTAETRRENIEKLRLAVTTNYGTPPPGGNVSMVADFHKTNLAQFNAELEKGDDGKLSVLKKHHDALAGLHRAAVVLQPARENLKLALEKVLPEASDAIAPGVTLEEAAPLLEERKQISAALKATFTAKTDLRPLTARVATLNDNVQELKALAARRLEVRADLDRVIAPSATVQTAIPDAPQAEAKVLLDQRDIIALAITSARFLPDVEIQAAAAIKLEDDIARLKEAIDQRKSNRQGWIVEANKLAAGLDTVDYLDMEAVTEARKKLSEQLEGPFTADKDRTAPDLIRSLADTVIMARQEAGNLGSVIESLKERIAALDERAKSKDYKDLPGVGDIRKSLAGYKKELEQGDVGTLLDITVGGSDFREDLDQIPGQLDAAIKAGANAWERANGQKGLEALAKTIRTRLADLTAQAEELDPNFKSTALTTAAETAAEKIEEQLENGTKPAILGAYALLDGFAQEVQKRASEYDEIVERVGFRRTAVLQRTTAKDPAPVPAGIPAALEAARDAVTQKLDGDLMALTTEILKEGERLADAFEQKLALAGQLTVAWKDIQARLKPVRALARTALQPELDRQYTQLDKEADVRRAHQLAQVLVKLLDQATAEKTQEIGTKGKLGSVELDGTKLDAAVVDVIYDLVGPAGVDDVQPEQLATLCSCFKGATEDQGKALRFLVQESFAGNGKVLANLARTGDKEAILELATAYADPGAATDRTNLQSLVADGGLAESPTVIGDLLGFGVKTATDKGQQRTANVAKLKAVGAAFSGPDGAKSMRTVATDCGMGQARTTGPARPGALAEVFEGGFEGDATKLRSFADAFGGDTDDDHKKRKGVQQLMTEGGLTNRPRPLGPLVKRLTETDVAAGADTLKAIGEKFTTKVDREKLALVLENGGISGDTKSPEGVEDPARKHEHADTLAKVFTDGFESDPAKLKTFAQSFGDTGAHAHECKDMMDSWNEYPDAHEDSRQPGKKIDKLLKGQFGGNVRKLQQSFTTQMKGFASGSSKQRQATRLAPYFEGKTNTTHPPVPANDKGLTQIITNYICKRHVPKFVKPGDLANNNSYFPPLLPDGETEMNADELFDMIDEAMPNMPAPGSPSATIPTVTKDVDLHVGVGFNGAMPHCQPVATVVPPHPREVPVFDRNQAKILFRAVGIPAP